MPLQGSLYLLQSLEHEIYAREAHEAKRFPTNSIQFSIVFKSKTIS